MAINSIVFWQKVKSGTGTTFAITESDFKEGPNGEDPKIKAPGTYLLTAWQKGAGKPMDSMIVVFPKVELKDDILKDDHGSVLILATRLEGIECSAISIADSAGIIEFSVTPNETNEGDFGYVIDVANKTSYTDKGYVDIGTWGNNDHKVIYWAPVERISDLRPIGGPDMDNVFFKVGAFNGTERTDNNFISSDYKKTSILVYSSFKYLVDVKKSHEDAISFILKKYSFLDLSPIDGIGNLSYESESGLRGLCSPSLIPGKWSVTLYDDAFTSENVCASTIGHEVEHANKGTWPLGASETIAYNWEYVNCYRTGNDRSDLDISWESQEENTNYPDTGYQPYVDND